MGRFAILIGFEEKTTF